MTQRQDVFVDASHDELARVRTLVQGWCEQAGMTEVIGTRLALAADEVCTNIIDYGNPTGPIELAFSSAGDAVGLTITDDGDAFDPRSIAAADVRTGVDRPIGGLGWHLVANCVDEIDYRRADGRNVLTLTIRGPNEPR